MADNTFQYFVGREQQRMVRFLERNTSVSEFMAALVDHLSNLAASEGVRPEQVQLEQPFITPDGYLRGRVVVKR